MNIIDVPAPEMQLTLFILLKTSLNCVIILPGTGLQACELFSCVYKFDTDLIRLICYRIVRFKDIYQVLISSIKQLSCWQSEWPRGLRPAPILESLVRIPLEAWMSVCIYTVFMLFCM
jgi:hypothetical protein